MFLLLFGESFICLLDNFFFRTLIVNFFTLGFMSREEVHAELNLLGVSDEVHALVDDLALDFGPVPDWWRIHLANKSHVYKPVAYVYKPRPAYNYVQGKFF